MNADGQCGVGHQRDVLAPEATVMPKMKGAKVLVAHMAAGSRHSMLVIAKDGSMGSTAGGKVFVWGANSDGRLGLGHDRNEPLPVPVEALLNHKMVLVSAGEAHSGAVDTNGNLYMWGLGSYGRLGLGEVMDVPLARRVPLPDDPRVSQVALGSFHSVVLAGSRTQSVYTWGYGEALGNKVGGGISLSPLVVSLEDTKAQVLQIAAGPYHTLVLMEDGELITFGQGASGRLGTGHSKNHKLPVSLGAHGFATKLKQSTDGEKAATQKRSLEHPSEKSLKRSAAASSQPGGKQSWEIAKVDCGEMFTCAVTWHGALYTWGSGARGQLGTGSLQDSWVPKVGTGEEGSGWMWGSSELGKLGLGEATSSDSIPVAIRAFAKSTEPYKVPMAVSCGQYHTAVICVRDQERGQFQLGECSSASWAGDLKSLTFGGGWFGRLGHNDMENQYEPKIISSLITKIRTVHCGAYHTCGLSYEKGIYNDNGELAGDLWVWGRNRCIGEHEHAKNSFAEITVVALCSDLDLEWNCLPFTVEELAQALKAIPAVKAVARPCAPGTVWKGLALQLAPILHSEVRTLLAAQRPTPFCRAKQTPRLRIAGGIGVFLDIEHDGQLGNAFRSEAALDTLLSNLSTTLALLQEFGMTINSAKCTALVAVRGTASRKLRSKLIAVRDGKEWLKIPGAGLEEQTASPPSTALPSAICAGPEPCWQNTAQIVNNNTVFPAQMADSKLDGPVRGQRMITDADLRNLTSQEWGSRVLEIVGHRHWHHMRREQTACEYLATRCCLCDQFLGRTQDLNHHLKTMHPEYWPHTAAKGKQLTNMYGEDTPCPYCHAVFKNMHQCTVWTQLAMLVIYGGGQTHAASTESSSGLACEICGQQFDNAEALHSHLARAHRLVSSSFNLARDSVAGQPACNHCGGLFDGIESLRSHVNQGRCPTFNPDLPTEVVDVQQRWTDATCHGQLAKHLGDAHTRLQLTLRCQSCSAKYSRSADMMGHLQTAHSALWSASQPLTHLLIELAYSEYGCQPVSYVRNPFMLESLPFICRKRTGPMDAPHMEDAEDATTQIWQAFQELSPILDQTLKLSQNAPPKRQRRGEHTTKQREPQGSQEKVQLAQALVLLTKLTLKLDRELQTLKREDTFVFFFANKGKESCLQTLVQATEVWVAKLKEKQEEGTTVRMQPLRQHLLQVLLNTLLTRVEQLGNAPEGSEILKAAMHTKVLLQDKTCPYLEWCHSKKELIVSKKKPLGLKRLHQICTDLLEALTNPQMVVKFHSLPSGAKQETSPWKLQVSLRLDHPWQLLLELCGSAIWLLMGASLKVHSLEQSPLAHNLQKAMNLHSSHRKGKGKGKGKMDLELKQAMLWTTLSTSTWQTPYWGEQCQELQNFLASDHASGINLSCTDWFQQIVCCWGDRDPTFDPDQITQQDAAEFVATWFSLMRPMAFDMAWERRFEENGNVRVFDVNSTHQPICLKFDAMLAYSTTCDLTQLFNLWCQVDGMRTALLGAPPCLCIQIDRCVSDAMNNIFRSECMIQTDEPCLVPFFQTNTLQYETAEYHVVALTAHLGMDRAGHIRTALRLAPSIVCTVHPANWLLTEVINCWRDKNKIEHEELCTKGVGSLDFLTGPEYRYWQATCACYVGVFRQDNGSLLVDHKRGSFLRTAKDNSRYRSEGCISVMGDAEVPPAWTPELLLETGTKPHDPRPGTRFHATTWHPERTHWWNQLDSLLHSLAHRNVLALTGDFNCNLVPSPTHSGPDQYRWRGHMTAGAMHQDAGHFTSLLRMHGLTALNSWDPGMPFTAEELERELSRIPACKAVARYLVQTGACINHGVEGPDAIIATAVTDVPNLAVLQAGPDVCWKPNTQAFATDRLLTSTMFAPKMDPAVRGTAILTDADLSNMLSQEWGHRVLTIVGSRNWHHMKKETAACSYLAQRCCLCDHFLGRTQELHRHLKLHHPEFWNHVQEKGHQLMNLHGEDPPCPYCGALFKAAHQCPVWCQLAMLLIYGGGISAGTTHVPAILRCEICFDSFTTSELLHEHLIQEHRLKSQSYNPARDSLEGEPVCAHCLAMYDNMESLRSHVNQGRCPKFNPALPTEVIDIQPQWVDAMCHGKIADVLRDAHVRLQLTLRCQNCSSRYTHPADLSGHLQSAHSSLWSEAQVLTGIMTSLIYSEAGCTCNPSITAPRAGHICLPLRQLSMQYMRLQGAVLFPHQPTDEELVQLFSENLPRESRFLLERTLTAGTLTDFWTHATHLDLLRDTCTLCGAHMHPADLVLHMYEAHQCGLPIVKFLKQQLVPKFAAANHDPPRCFACKQVYTIAAADDDMTDDALTSAAQVHFPKLHMADMNMPEPEETNQQVWTAFQAIGALLDDSLQLEPNAAGPKRQRKEEPTKAKGHPQTKQLKEKIDVAHALSLMAKLTLRLDRELQQLKREDTFIFFFGHKGPNSSLSHLVKAADDWVNNRQSKSQMTMPLRQHLMQVVFNTLLTRLTKLGETKDGSEVQQAAISNLILLPDKTCPYLEWDMSQKQLKVSQRPPLSLTRLHQLCQDMLEALTDVNLVTAFHALPTSNQEVAPWKLTLSLRADAPWQNMQVLSHSAIWLLMATSLKPHGQKQSPLAQSLQQAMGLTRTPKGRGKGKTKTVMTKQE
ncbi:unnamed protein product [Cladocopium goreaui]|uniref:40S ribosomal protein S2 n=1 Tax=Cladocopium goreaui TaxID=2562237 RepID=A0A9P1FST2_9DINO|nr:unnamed protein product [Cladocopium goreaui]